MIALALPLLLAAVAVVPTPLPGPASPPPPSALPVPSGSPSPVPSVEASASPARAGAHRSRHAGPVRAEATHTPAALATVGPATATYIYRFVPGQPEHPPADQPQIFAVYLNAKALHSQGPIDIRVITSANVVKVSTTSNGHTGSVSEVGPGDFQAHSKLPKLPIIASGITTTLNFTAVSSDGKTVTVGVPIQLL